MCIVKELECLCFASAHHQLYGSIQENEQLVKTAICMYYTSNRYSACVRYIIVHVIVHNSDEQSS